MSHSPRIWALLGAHAGDNNQVLALAETLGVPFEAKQLHYNGWRRLGPHLLGASLCSLSADCRTEISGNPPDLTISAGHRSVPVVQHIRRRSGGRTRSVHVGYPRISPDNFDMVVATEEYPLPEGPTVLRIPFALTRDRLSESPESVDLPRPRRLFIVGGPTLYWRLGRQAVMSAVAQLIEAASKTGGSVLAVASPRTSEELFDAVRRCLDNALVPTLAVPASGPPNYAMLLRSADQLFVTADSVAMISDAVATGKPVGLIPIEPTRLGRSYMALLRRGARMHPRDLRFFWNGVQAFVGSLDAPKASAPPEVNSIVAARVRELLDLG